MKEPLDLLTEAATKGVKNKIGVPGNFAKFTGKHMCQCLFLNKVKKENSV